MSRNLDERNYKKKNGDKKKDCPENSCEKKKTHPERKRCQPEEKEKFEFHARKNCEEFTTIRVGFFAGRQPNEDIFPGETVAGTDISLAYYIFNQLLGYCVEFYEIPVRNVGLNELNCGLVDVVASSTVFLNGTVNTGNGTIPRNSITNYLITDIAPNLNLAVIYNNSLGVICGTGANTLKDIWLAIGGNGPCPIASTRKFGVNAPGTVQSTAVRAGLTAAYPGCSAATLNAFFTAQTLNVSTFTCAQLSQGLINSSYVALLSGPRGDLVQQQVTFNSVNASNPNTFTLCPNVGSSPGGNKGWAIASCKLALEAQKALNVAIKDGTYDRLQDQVVVFPGFDQTCVIAGLGVTSGVAPPRNASINEGSISDSCCKNRCDDIEILCPCESSNIARYPIAGHIDCPIFGNCDSCTITVTEIHRVC